MGTPLRNNSPIDERFKALGQLLYKADDELNLPYGAISEVSKATRIHRHTLTTIWERHLSGVTIGNRRSNGSLKRKRVRESKIKEKLTKIYVEQRGTIRNLVDELQLSKSTIHRAVKSGEIVAVNSHLNPHLIDKQKKKTIRILY